MSVGRYESAPEVSSMRCFCSPVTASIVVRYESSPSYVKSRTYLPSWLSSSSAPSQPSWPRGKTFSTVERSHRTSKLSFHQPGDEVSVCGVHLMRQTPQLPPGSCEPSRSSRVPSRRTSKTKYIQPSGANTLSLSKDRALSASS